MRSARDLRSCGIHGLQIQSHRYRKQNLCILTLSVTPKQYDLIIDGNVVLVDWRLDYAHTIVNSLPVPLAKPQNTRNSV